MSTNFLFFLWVHVYQPYVRILHGLQKNVKLKNLCCVYFRLPFTVFATYLLIIHAKLPFVKLKCKKMQKFVNFFTVFLKIRFFLRVNAIHDEFQARSLVHTKMTVYIFSQYVTLR